MKKNLIKIALATIALVVLFNIIPSVVSRINNNSSSTQETTQYKSIRRAIEDGSVRLGMTYEEIKAICGAADDIDKVNGMVHHVRYYEGSYRAGLWFDNYGLLVQINE